MADGVFIEVEGRPCCCSIASFAAVRTEAPPLAVVTDVIALPPTRADCGDGVPHRVELWIHWIRGVVDQRTLGSRRTSRCAATASRAVDPRDRRYRYPFVNCTDCGPRFTIIRRCPTTARAPPWRAFPMCGRARASTRIPATAASTPSRSPVPTCGRGSLAAVDDSVPTPAERSGAVLSREARAARGGRDRRAQGPGRVPPRCDATDEPRSPLLRGAQAAARQAVRRHGARSRRGRARSLTRRAEAAAARVAAPDRSCCCARAPAPRCPASRPATARRGDAAVDAAPPPPVRPGRAHGGAPPLLVMTSGNLGRADRHRRRRGRRALGRSRTPAAPTTARSTCRATTPSSG